MKKTNSGFTLIETILYLAIFSVVMAGIMSSVYVLFESNGRSQTRAMLHEEKEFLLGKINYALSGARVVTVPVLVAPAVSASGSSLVVERYDTSSATVELSGSDITYNGTIINNSNVKISKMVFIHSYAGGENPESVEVGFTISSLTANGMILAEVASTTRYMRK